MAWISYGRWHCIYVENDIDNENIRANHHILYVGKENEWKSFLSYGSNNPRLFAITKRKGCIATLAGSQHTFSSTDLHERDFQIDGRSHLFVVACFLSDKRKFHRGDMVAVFAETYDYACDPYNTPKTFMEKAAHVFNSGYMGRQKERAVEVFAQRIADALRKADAETARQAGEAKLNREVAAKRAAEDRSRRAEEERKARLASDLRLREQKEAHELEIARIRQETQELAKRAAIERQTAQEEAELLAETLKLRKRIAKLDKEADSELVGQLLGALSAAGTGQASAAGGFRPALVKGRR